VLLLCALSGVWRSAHAQAVETVLERKHPGYEVAGIPFGGFRLYPSISIYTGATDNIFASHDNPKSDVYVQLQPSILLASNWARHSVTLSGQVSRNQNANHDSENTTDYTIQAKAHLDVSQSLTATLTGVNQQATERRAESDAARGAATPSQYARNMVGAEIAFESGRIEFGLGSTLEQFRYDDLRSATGGVINNTARDVDIVTVTARANYAAGPGIAVFALLDENRHDHTDKPPGVASQDSHGERVLVGANFGVTHLLRGELGVGYLEQHPDRGGHIQGFAAKGKLIWLPTELTNVTLLADRSFRESTSLGSPGVVQTDLRVRVDHELLRNLILAGTAYYSGVDYDGLDRKDGTRGGTFSATYRLARGVEMFGAYDYLTRKSTGKAPGSTFDVNTISLGVSLSY
jgi:hypothetical protein